jgi:NADH:ubiquinone oxidoreductase subunit 3 (subunit A)
MAGGGAQVTVWPLIVYFMAVILVVAGMLAVSYVLGQRHQDPATGAPYESGILSQGSAHVRLSVKFYLVAMFFVVFDLEGRIHLSLGGRRPRTGLGWLLRGAHWSSLES